MSGDLPLTTRFALGPAITLEQRDFLRRHGFILFSRVASADEVAMLCDEMERIAREWIESGQTRVFGIFLFFGTDERGEPFLQRLAFTSVFSERVHAFVRDPGFAPMLGLIGDGPRIGDREKDGVVFNRYENIPGSVYPRLGWHTDGLRDLFYGRMPDEQLNVGLHLDRCTRSTGGLRLIPGSHRQGFWSMCFRKPYFVRHRADPEEVCIETEPRDLTVHDGQLRHRVARSEHVGAPSLRRSMYLPYLTGPYEPKSEDSPTPASHKVAEWLRRRGPRRRQEQAVAGCAR